MTRNALLFTLAGLACIAGAPLASVAADDATTAPAPVRPDAEQFVILGDGRFFAGTVIADADKQTVTVEVNGTIQSFKEPEVALAYGVRDGKRKQVYPAKKSAADDAGVFVAWKNWLDAAFPKGDPSVAAPTGQSEAYRDAVIAAVKTCRKWGAHTASGALLAECEAAGGWDGRVQEAAVEVIPDNLDHEEGFPFSMEDEVRTKRWAKWCKALVPLGGTFVNVALHPQKDKINKDWEDSAIILRTRNIELWSRVRATEEPHIDRDIKVVTDVIRQAESTVRALESLLGKPAEAGDEFLMVRLLESRAKYLQDISGGGMPPQWSGGFFSPGDAISRFYVEEKGSLRETVSHELTHHWLERRKYRGGGKGFKQPGVWIVEGFARFVEHQSAQFQKGKFGFDNERCQSVWSCVGARKMSALFGCAELVDYSKEDFELKLAAGNRLGLFYEQSGAFVFFMMNRRGPEGRKLLVEYLRKHYEGEFWDAGKSDARGLIKIDVEKGKPITGGWKFLGFTSAREMDTAFTSWLDGLANAEK